MYSQGSVNSVAMSSAATTNATLVSSGPTKVFAITVSNVGGAAAFLKLYNTAVAPTVGTTVPALTIPVPTVGLTSVQFGPRGYAFPVGFSFAMTNLIADSDTTAVAAAQLKLLVDWGG